MRQSFRKHTNGLADFIVFDPLTRTLRHATFDLEKGPKNGYIPLLQERYIEGIPYQITLKGSTNYTKRELSLKDFEAIAADNADQSGTRRDNLTQLATVQYNSITNGYHFWMEARATTSRYRLPTKGRLLVTGDNLQSVIEKMKAGDNLLSMIREQRPHLEDARKRDEGLQLS